MTTTPEGAQQPQTQQDPRAKHQDEFPAHEDIGQPGLTSQTAPDPDHGEESYVGSGKLKGRRALITGGDSGIGRAVAIAFAREGADVAIVHLPEEQEDAETTLKLVREAGQNAAAYAQDLRATDAAETVLQRALEDLGGLDILVLNAAYQRKRSGIDETPIEEVQRVFDTNLISHIALTKAAVPHLNPGSAIITTTSIQAAGPAPPLFDYAMTKAAQVAFTEVLAQELTPAGIRVNAVAPGPIWTPLIPATNFPEDKVESFGSDTPMERAGQPAELAGAYVYLASEDASYTSGAVIPVTGGKPFTGG
ncbi:SDR family oxidoreductase [Nesterenkonia alkaliphila]|uniref:SDR family oxidoreductase n=1 Tax=Nesterenkonia alkaliphila TaxID=1463631 RepID=A0A7K1ULK8_9MICC|nr:SDR family oxidoreductase [Nesterenkonia alkaliphila]MVT27353.1 SDR family oxidoreductase [Nesterenkonia alkaliphila]GFZ80639.1 dehydrogenase [Nesterenkonia alkaliphila]